MTETRYSFEIASTVNRIKTRGYIKSILSGLASMKYNSFKEYI